MVTVRRWDIRTLLIISLAAVAGAAWAAYNLWSVGDARDGSVFQELIWIVFATPFATFMGWWVARPKEGWWAAFGSFCVYFFAIFAGARLERIFVGETASASSGHAFYFRATLVIGFVGALAIALHRARSVGTIPLPNSVATQVDTPKTASSGG